MANRSVTTGLQFLNAEKVSANPVEYKPTVINIYKLNYKFNIRKLETVQH